MKKILSLAAAFLFTYAAMAQATTDLKAENVVKFNVETHSFDKIKQSVPVIYSFEIKNISTQPVTIENSWASCGCTTPEKIEKPIMPGETAKLKVQYNAAALGTFNKEVFVKIAGIEQPKTLHLSGEVLTAEAYDVWAKENAGKKGKN